MTNLSHTHEFSTDLAESLEDQEQIAQDHALPGKLHFSSLTQKMSCY